MRHYRHGMTAVGEQVDEDMSFEDAMYQGSRINAEPVDLHPRTLVTYKESANADPTGASVAGP